MPAGRAKLVLNDHDVEARAGACNGGPLGDLTQLQCFQVPYRCPLEEGVEPRRLAPLSQRIQVDTKGPDTEEVIEGAQAIGPRGRVVSNHWLRSCKAAQEVAETGGRVGVAPPLALFGIRVGPDINDNSALGGEDARPGAKNRKEFGRGARQPVDRGRNSCQHGGRRGAT